MKGGWGMLSLQDFNKLWVHIWAGFRSVACGGSHTCEVPWLTVTCAVQSPWPRPP